MTYEELIALAKSGDVLIGEKNDFVVSSDGLVIDGVNTEEEFQLDVRIRIEPDGRLRVWVRDHEGPETLVGREWDFETAFRDYDNLVTWVYEW